MKALTSIFTLPASRKPSWSMQNAPFIPPVTALLGMVHHWLANYGRELPMQGAPQVHGKKSIALVVTQPPLLSYHPAAQRV